MGGHRRACLLYVPSHFVLQPLNYLDYIDPHHERIKIFHVKDAECNPTGKQGGVWRLRAMDETARPFPLAGRRTGRLLGHLLADGRPRLPGWAVPESECCLKQPQDGACEGAKFIADHIIRVADRAFDDFADAGTDKHRANRKLLGLV